jgi:hypothetical protein
MQRVRRPDLRRLLPGERRPQPELALPLQRDRLGVEPAGEHHVAVERARCLGRDVERVAGAVAALAVGTQQLHHRLIVCHGHR